MNNAVVINHTKDIKLQLLFPNTYDNTFVIPPCWHRPDFHSINSVVISLHENVPPHISVAMMAADITNISENKPLDTGSEIFWLEEE